MAHPPRAAGVSTLAVPGPSDQAAGAQVQHRAGPARALQRVKTSGAALAWVLSVHTRSRRQAARWSMREMRAVWIKVPVCQRCQSCKGLRGKGIIFDSGSTGTEFIPADAAVLLLPVYGEKVRQGLRGSANSSDLGAAPHLPAGILSPQAGRGELLPGLRPWGGASAERISATSCTAGSASAFRHGFPTLCGRFALCEVGNDGGGYALG